jgi:RNA polymerase sigma-70 factor (ECF subfamily)
LFERIAEGDEAAFEAIFERYLPRLYPVILQIVHSESVVKDVVQDVFLRLWLARERLGEVAVPRNYIFRMAYNQSFKHLRKLLREERAQQRMLEHTPPQEEDSDTPDSLSELAETRQLIEQAIAALPEQARRIYRLSRVSGYKSQEIADQLGLSIQSVRNSLTRSGMAIKERLARHGITIPIVLFVWFGR